MFITSILMVFISILPLLLGFLLYKTLGKSTLSTSVLCFMIFIGVWQLNVSFLFMGDYLSEETIEIAFKLTRFGQILLNPTFLIIFYMFSKTSKTETVIIKKGYLFFTFGWGILAYLLNLTNIGVTGVVPDDLGIYYPTYGIGNIAYTINFLLLIGILTLAWKEIYTREHETALKTFMLTFFYYTWILLAMGLLNFFASFHLLGGTLAIIIFSTLIMFLVLKFNFEVIRKLNKMVETSSKPAYANDLIANLIHELRNPLSAITGYTELLPNRQVLNEDGQIIASQLMLASNHMNEIVNGYVDFVKSGHIKLQEYELDLCIDEALSIVQPRLIKNPIHISVDLTNAPYRSFMDKEKLRQVFINLICNSVEAFPPSQTNKKIEIYGKKNNVDEIIIDIKDNGKGISEHIKRKLFKANKTDKEKGLGLGLIVSRNIAMAHGGSLELMNSDTTGTHFRLTVPTIYTEEGLNINLETTKNAIQNIR